MSIQDPNGPVPWTDDQFTAAAHDVNDQLLDFLPRSPTGNKMGYVLICVNTEQKGQNPAMTVFTNGQTHSAIAACRTFIHDAEDGSVEPDIIKDPRAS